jgi:hypothetical protein
VAVFLGTFGFTAYKSYQDNLCIWNQTIAADRAFYADLCTSAEKKELYNVWRECQEKEHSLHKPVQDYAMISTIKDYGLCFSNKCEDLLLRNVYLIPLVVAMVALVGLVVAGCGCVLLRLGTTSTALPTHYTVKPPKKQL